MLINKNIILKSHCYTLLVYERINKKLGTSLSKEEVRIFIKDVLNKTEAKYYKKKGKNFYITNKEYNIKITINSNTYRIITVNLLLKRNTPFVLKTCGI